MTLKGINNIRKKIRISIIKNSYKVKACHLGSSLSAVDILVDIYFNKLKENDIFLFSKASGVCALYSVLAEKKVIPQNKVAFYLKKYPLPNKKVPGILFNGGSLGHGLPLACGVALAKKLKGEKGKVYCLISDAEMQEGTFWESMLFIRHHKLSLEVYCDWNNWQACGRTNDILRLGNAKELFKDLKGIDTTKGKGISFCENDNSWHYRNLTESEMKQALKELQ